MKKILLFALLLSGCRQSPLAKRVDILDQQGKLYQCIQLASMSGEAGKRTKDSLSHLYDSLNVEYFKLVIIEQQEEIKRKKAECNCK